MKKVIRLKNFKSTPDAERSVMRCINTAGGAETASINLATGEITYSSGCNECVLQDELKKEGLEVEE